jgi:hypothetical protein
LTDKVRVRARPFDFAQGKLSAVPEVVFFDLSFGASFSSEESAFARSEQQTPQG